MKNTYKLAIANEQYSIVSDEPAELIAQAATLVDQLIKDIAAKAPHVDEKRIVVLAALQIASNLLSEKNRATALERTHERLVTYLNKATEVSA